MSRRMGAWLIAGLLVAGPPAWAEPSDGGAPPPDVAEAEAEPAAASASGIVLVADPVGPAEQALVDALRRHLNTSGLTVRPAVARLAPDAPAPEGRLDVRFDRTHRSTAIWLDWSAPDGRRGWAARLDALDDPAAGARTLAEALDIGAIGDARRVETGATAAVERRIPADTRYSILYNAAVALAGMHAFDGEARWPLAAVGVGYTYSSRGEDDSDDFSEAGAGGTTVLDASTHAIRANVRWYGAAPSDWYMFLGGRYMWGESTQLEYVLDGERTTVSETRSIVTLGLGGVLGAATGPCVGMRMGWPLRISDGDVKAQTGAQSILAALDLELSVGWRF